MLVVGLMGAFFMSNGSPSSAPDRGLKASVLFEGGVLEVTNNTEVDWPQCDVTLNGAYNLPRAMRFPAHKAETYFAGSFADDRGFKFQAAVQRLNEVRISCRGPDGFIGEGTFRPGA